MVNLRSSSINGIMTTKEETRKLNRIKAVLAETGYMGKWLAEQLGKDPATINNRLKFNAFVDCLQCAYTRNNPYEEGIKWNLYYLMNYYGAGTYKNEIKAKEYKTKALKLGFKSEDFNF